MKYLRIVNGPIEENCYLAWDPATREAVLIDPGFLDPGTLRERMAGLGLTITAILNTHGHWDHIMNDQIFRDEYRARLGIHEDETAYLKDPALSLAMNHDLESRPITQDFTFSDGDEIRVGEERLTVLHTPGHTRGSVIFWNEELAFTGDTLFYGSVGRCDLPGSDREAMSATLERIKRILPPSAVVLPGHGTLESTFKEQLTINPFLTGKMKPK